MDALHPVYSHENYRDYLTESLEAQGRGSRLKLAEFLGCQPSFVSQVLSGKNELSLEHAQRINLFLNHGKVAALYFIHMVQLSKAGTFELQKFFREQLAAIKDQQLQVHNVVQKTELGKEDLLTYYGSWLYVSVHMLVNIPMYQDPKVLQAKLGASDFDFTETINFLTKTGLVKMQNGRLDIGEANIHLKKTSPYAQSASVLTRLKMLEKLKLSDPTAVNFSSNFTISRAAHTKLKKRILDFIVELDELIDSEEPEEFCTLVLDLIEH
jgi:uncharacterized protein (TIGR02147 family)